MINFDGGTTVDDIVAVAVGGETVRISDATRDRVVRAARDADALSARIPTYGRTTGVGANRSTIVETADGDHGLRLLRSHATDAGDPLSAPAVRAMLAVRLAQLARAGSGIRADVLDGVAAMLNDDALPTVLRYGAIGTADLAALAATGLTLQGELPASRPLAPMRPWGSENALAFMSSSALTIGRACLALVELEEVLRASIVAYSLSFVALDGNPSPFSAAAAAAAAAPGAEAVAERVRSFVGDGIVEPARIQDSYGLRAFVVSTAAAWDAAGRLRSRLDALIDVAQENPLFVFDGDGAVVHHAGFFQAALGLASDGMNLALAQTGPISFSRIRMLNEPDLTGRRPFLAVGPAGSSGTLMIEYVAASALGELRHAAQPASLSSVVLSRGAEEDASFATQAVAQLEQALEAARVLLGCELVESSRLLRQRGIRASSLPSRLADAARAVSVLPADDDDRSLRGDLSVAQALIPELAAL
ncbi:histidine ammonia-lyase [Agromyces badenianii]|uniref:Histidine ammonia-lyase n=1 Tax=Agromyces badenianii TaxID=2080742 RepID=A0A2S0WYM5_9MICO|nr:aromatic amino acid lyase [Agromyces badenianii]AWB96457.1 histidine ammonia-lyase [Agromyces badenianii]